MTSKDNKMPKITLLLLGLALPALFSCNTTPTGGGNTSDYHVIGSLVINIDRDSTITAADFRHGSARVPRGEVTLGSKALTFDQAAYEIDSVFSRRINSPTDFNSGTRYLKVIDSTLFTDSAITTSPGTFSILTIAPPNRIVAGLETVSLTWSASSGTAGYVVVAVLKRRAYTDSAYVAYVTSLNTAVTIPRSAFYLSGAAQPDTGWYYTYLYSYTGAPDSALASVSLPGPMPSQLADNINRTNLDGHFGSVLVAHRDSVHVLIQP
jgi:hypothetical protein